MRLIANPAAGGSTVRRQWDEILETLRDVFPGLDAVQTRHVGHGTELAREAIEAGHDNLLSLGGDGTHSEVAAGIASVETDRTIALGVLHGGTGGDFSRLLGRGTLREQAERLRDLPAKPIDLGRVRYQGGERVFLNEVSFGMSAAICVSVNKSRKRLGGQATFLIHTLKTLATYKPQAVEIDVDGEILQPGPIQSVLACNGQWAGGGMRFAPRAGLADGAFDLTVIRDAPTLQAIRLTPKLYNGQLLEQPQVDSARGRRIGIKSLGEPLWIEADGEVLGTTPAVVEVLPGALNLMGAPADFLDARP